LFPEVTGLAEDLEVVDIEDEEGVEGFREDVVRLVLFFRFFFLGSVTGFGGLGFGLGGSGGFGFGIGFHISFWQQRTPCTGFWR
jgi:hypothetical protein